MAFDFPSSPTTGQTYQVTGGPTYVYNGTAWQVLTPGSRFNRTTFTATANQTTFTVSYVIGAVDVFVNGVKYVSGLDFTATNGTSVVLTTGANAGDTVEVVSYSQVNYTNTVQKTGDTMTGTLVINPGALDESLRIVGTSSPYMAIHTGSTRQFFLLSNASSGTNLVVETNNPMLFSTNNAERMRISAAGNVGIGIGAPTDSQTFGRALDMRGSTGSAYYAATTDNSTRAYFAAYSGAGYLGTETNHPILFRTNNTERVRIDTSGNVGIGTGANIAAKLNVSGNQINFGTNPYIGLSSTYNTTDSYIQYVNSTNLLALSCAGGSNTGAIAFSTGTGTEKARVTSAGEFCIGTTTGGGYKLRAINDVNGTAGLALFQNQDQWFFIDNYYSSGVGQYTYLRASNSGGGYTSMYLWCSGLYQNASGTIYAVTTAGGNTSDVSVKTNLTPISGALEKLAQITGYEFDFTDEYKAKSPDATVQKHQIGVVAQEVETVFPEAVNEVDGLKTVNYEKLVAPLIEAIKEQQSIIEDLKARIVALENA